MYTAVIPCIKRAKGKIEDIDGFIKTAKVKVIDKDINESLDNILNLSVGGKAKMTVNMGEVGKAVGIVNGQSCTIEG
jgi:hypothetical protein